MAMSIANAKFNLATLINSLRPNVGTQEMTTLLEP